MVGIMVESKFMNSIWGKRIYNSLINKLRQKRIPFCQISDYFNANFKTVFIISTNKNWLSHVIKQLNEREIHPILLCNQHENLPGCIYNCVCADIHASMKIVFDVLKHKNRKRIAVCGINPNSVFDIDCVNSLENLSEQYPINIQFFYNSGSVEECFLKFYSKVDQFDTVICVNSFVLVYFVRRIKEINPQILDNLYIVNNSESEISKYYHKNVLSIKWHFEQYGEAAVYIYELLQKNSFFSTITIKTMWSSNIDTAIDNDNGFIIDQRESADAFYDDNSIYELNVVENLLSITDETDKRIIEHLMRNCTTEEISEACYLTTSAVKYRIKKIVIESGARDKTQITELLNKYLEL